MARIVDKFDGWLVLDYEKLRATIRALPPQYRTYTAIKKATGIGPQQLSEYTKGKRFPNLLNFKRLCLYIGISADELLGLKSADEDV